MMISFLVIILEFWLVMDYGYDGNVGINQLLIYILRYFSFLGNYIYMNIYV